MNSALRAHREEEGFTLIELLVVVIIIGILAAIAIPAFLNQRERAWQAELTSSVRNVALDAEAEATIYGGDYSRIGGAGGAVATQAELDTWVAAQLTELQTATGPVTYTAGDAAATATTFSVCMEHVQLNDGATPPVANASVTYDTAAGGLQDFAQAAC